MSAMSSTPTQSTPVIRSELAGQAPASDNPYLQGNFGPVSSEETFHELQVSGELPKDLAGTLLRNGPNPVGTVDDKHHWFVGDAMLHAISLEGGRARSYRNRFVRTPHIEQVLGLKAAPRSAHPYPIQGSGNVNVIQHAGRILALPEVGLPYELDGELATRGEYDFGAARSAAGDSTGLTLRSSMTAHPKIDPISGELLFFGYDFGPTHLRYHRADRNGVLDRTVEIDKPSATMMHDFGVTQSRIVFMDMPVVFDLELVAQGYGMPFRWSDEHVTRVGVMPRNGASKDVRWIEIEPCYVYHVLNAHDDGPRIVMDVVRYARTFDRDRRGPIEGALGRLERWRIDPDAGSVAMQVLDDTAQEFPRVDPRKETLPHRYGYSVELDRDPGQLMTRGLLKHDLVKGTRQSHALQAGQSASEGVFVPRGPGEDNGYVLAPVYDAITNKSEVRVLDAQNFDKAPLATIHLPVRIPFGFHGNFVGVG